VWTVDGVKRGTQKDVFIPAGEIEFCWLEQDLRVPRLQRITLTAGEEREVVWDGK
jgi:hypothetical protein